MQYMIAITLVCSILSARVSSEPAATDRAGTAPQEAAAVLIDNTPVEPLAIGGSIGILQTEELEKPAQACLSMLLNAVAEEQREKP